MSRRGRAAPTGTTTAAVLLCGALAAACGVNHGEPPRDPDTLEVAGDTVRGIIDVTGADPLTSVVLRRGDGSAVRVRGEVGETLRRAQGLEVRVSGRVDEHGIDATAFRVRGLGGMPAADGRLELDGDGVLLITPAGETLRYPGAPSRLRAMAGRHVWIAGEPGGPPQQWGQLDP